MPKHPLPPTAVREYLRDRVAGLRWPDGGLHIADFNALALDGLELHEWPGAIEWLEMDGQIWTIDDFAGTRVFPSALQPKQPGRRTLESLDLVPSGLTQYLRAIAGDIAQIAFHAYLGARDDADGADRFEFQVIARSATKRISDSVTKAVERGYKLDVIRKNLARATGPRMREAIAIAAPWLAEGSQEGIPTESTPAKRKYQRSGDARARAALAKAGYNGIGRRELQRTAFANKPGDFEKFVNESIASGEIVEAKRTTAKGGRPATVYRLANAGKWQGVNPLDPFSD